MTAQALVGQTVAGGRYQIVALLGEGAMGAVYQARQIAMDRMVALKVIKAELTQTAFAAARFEQEMRTTARIEHPNTVRVYDFGDAEGRLFLTMELLAGRSLGAIIETDGRLPLERIVAIGKQVAKALGAAHERGVVHRDLKPENVMLISSFGEAELVKVVDFGVAKSLDEDTAKLTATGSLVGTPAYMAPEQALGRPVDARSDLYALGIMLYQMASGRVPFHAPTMGGLLVAQATEPPPPLLEVAPGTSPALAALVMELLEKEPEARPQTAADVVARLDACLFPGAARRRGAKGKAWIYALVAILVAIAGGVVAAVATGGGKPASADAGGQAAAAVDAAGRALAGGCAELLGRARGELERDAAAALATAEQAVRDCPTEGDAHNVRGNALQKLGKLDDAEDAYVRALSVSPSYDAPRFNLGLLQLRRKDASAAATFTELLRRNPDHPNARLARAQAYLLAGKSSDALADLEEEVRRQPKNGPAWAALGQLREHLKQGDAQDALCKAKALGVAGIDAFCK